jgi:hypothetical protein
LAPEELEGKNFSGFYRHQWLQFGSGADLSKDLSTVKSVMNGSASLVLAPHVKQLQDNIAHRVFYNLYL